MKKFTLAIVLLLITSLAFAAVKTAYLQLTTLLASVTTVSVGDAYVFPRLVPYRSHQVNLEGASATSATVVVQGSNDNAGWKDLGTISVTSGTRTDVLVTQQPWIFERGSVTAISGTGAAVTLTVGD